MSSQGWRLRGDISWVLRDVSFSVAAGEMFGVVGTNGSGKTTLLQTIAGVLRPMRGSVAAAGRVTSLVDLSAGFHRELTGRENLRLAGVLLGLPRSAVQARYDDIVRFSGLDDETLAAPLRTYSSGMGLRLGFSLVAHSDPAVLVVDEVLAVGDEGFRARCVEKVEVLRRGGCAIVLVSHDLDLITAQCQRAALLHQGRLRQVGSPGEVARSYTQVLATEQGDGSPPRIPPESAQRASRRRRFI
ncbi:MAG: ATP-binding cassette domain-containing protein [Actinomycetota bacterium]|nr:ATP-binding cassette domain-containing protein [Actinomycetota bacterium]